MYVGAALCQVSCELSMFWSKSASQYKFMAGFQFCLERSVAWSTSIASVPWLSSALNNIVHWCLPLKYGQIKMWNGGATSHFFKHDNSWSQQLHPPHKYSLWSSMHTLSFKTGLYIIRESTALFRKQLALLMRNQMEHQRLAKSTHQLLLFSWVLRKACR